MNLLLLPWTEWAIGISLIGCFWVSRAREPTRAYRSGVVFTGIAFVCSLLAWLSFSLSEVPDRAPLLSIQPLLFGRQLFAIDELSAPLIPSITLLHLLAAMATSRTHMRRFSFSWSLAAEAIRLATFSTKVPWLLIGLLCAS